LVKVESLLGGARCRVAHGLSIGLSDASLLLRLIVERAAP
jgi:hypothetical protein